MSATKHVTVDGFVLPVQFNTLEIADEQIWSSNAGRNATGKFIGTLIATKKTIKGTLNPMSDAKMKTYLSKVNKSSFNVTFRDPDTNDDKTITCYRATPGIKVYSYHDNLPRYVGTTFEFIEI